MYIYIVYLSIHLFAYIYIHRHTMRFLVETWTFGFLLWQLRKNIGQDPAPFGMVALAHSLEITHVTTIGVASSC